MKGWNVYCEEAIVKAHIIKSNGVYYCVSWVATWRLRVKFTRCPSLPKILPWEEQEDTTKRAGSKEMRYSVADSAASSTKPRQTEHFLGVMDLLMCVCVCVCVCACVCVWRSKSFYHTSNRWRKHLGQKTGHHCVPGVRTHLLQR